jgi:signal transduction histidine kinase/CheY-like chemotaxis protein
MWAIIHDITERKWVEEKLREAEWKFQALFTKGPIGVAYHEMIYDEAGKPVDYRFLDANECYLELTGIDPRGKTVRQAFPGIENDPFDWIGTFGRVARTGEQLRIEQYFKTNNRWYDLVAYQYKPDHFVAAFQEITARKQAEAERAKLQEQLTQAQKMESVGRLAGGVAHDFNNMLGVILGHVEMAMEQVHKSDPLYSSLEEIRKAAQRSADLTRQLLAFGRKQIIMPEVLPLNETVAGMLKMLRRLIGENINLVWQPGATLWPVKMDPSQIDQILINLCVNARDAIAGIGSVTIETENKLFTEDECAKNTVDIPGEYVLLSVSDTGCGMKKEMLPLLFEPFFTTKDIGKGTGLGLSTVYGIVKQNSGFITVYSEPEHGTTFKIYLPRHAGRREPAVATKPEQPTQRGCETILLVEDEPTMMTMATVMLEKQGYTVLPASTPGTAIRLANDHAGIITLMITDVIMPEMNGRDLAKALLTLYPTLKCLFMSAYTANVIANQGILDPGAQFIQKPFSRNELAAKVRKILDSK